VLSTNELESNNRRFSAAFMGGRLSSPPARRLLVLTCMDARIDPQRMLGLQDGDANILRNAGGRVSDDFLPLGSDMTASVRRDVRHLRDTRVLAPHSEVHGYVYDVSTGRITSVDCA
jgi:carbonic anhydrase